MIPWAGALMHSYLEMAHLKQAREQLAQNTTKLFKRGPDVITVQIVDMKL